MLFIAEEVIKGWGRRELLTCEQAGIAPELLCLAGGRQDTRKGQRAKRDNGGAMEGIG